MEDMSTASISNTQGIEVAPGTVLLREYHPEEKVGRVIVPTAQEEHSRKLGNNFPMALVLAVGVVDFSQKEIDEQRISFCKPGDIVWYDYRGTGVITLQGQQFIIAPRQYIRGRLVGA